VTYKCNNSNPNWNCKS